MLELISKHNADGNNLVKFFQHFEYVGHSCLVFEMLDCSLCNQLEKQQWQPLALAQIHPIAQQVWNIVLLLPLTKTLSAYLLLSPAPPQGTPQWVICLHLALSRASSTVIPTISNDILRYIHESSMMPSSSPAVWQLHLQHQLMIGHKTIKL